MAQPGDVVAVEGPGLQAGRTGVQQGLVCGEEVLQKLTHAPAIQEQVVLAPDELPGGLAHAEDGQTHEGRAGQVEAASAVLGEECVALGLLLIGVKVAPVVLEPGELGTRVHHLERLGQPFPHEAGAKDGVVPHQQLPRAPEALRIEVALESERGLDEVDPRVRGEQGVEENALLHRGERVDVLEVRTEALQEAVERVLLQGGDWEVRRSEAARVLGGAPGDQRAQTGQEPLRERLHGGALVQVRAVCEGQMQLASAHESTHLELLARLVAWSHRFTH